eukprot:gene3859-biopygen28027
MPIRSMFTDNRGLLRLPAAPMGLLWRSRTHPGVVRRRLPVAENVDGTDEGHPGGARTVYGYLYRRCALCRRVYVPVGPVAIDSPPLGVRVAFQDAPPLRRSVATP